MESRRTGSFRRKKRKSREDTAEAETERARHETAEENREAEEENARTKKGFFGKKKEKKDKKDEQIEELTDKVKRQMAEFDNFRKRYREGKIPDV